MGREFHVRFREGLGVQFPRATRLVIGFADESDARRVHGGVAERFGKYGFDSHPDKTRTGAVPAAPTRPDREDSPQAAAGDVRLSGFTH